MSGSPVGTARIAAQAARRRVIAPWRCCSSRELASKKLTLAAAESCTGGLVGAEIVACPGASQYFRGSIVAYDNCVKQTILKVDEQTLREHGAA